MWVSAFLGTGPGHSRELGAAERHRKVSSGQISQYNGDLPGPSLLPLVLQLQLTALFSRCVLWLWDSRVTVQTSQGALFSMPVANQGHHIPSTTSLLDISLTGSSPVGTGYNPFF